MNSKIKVPIHIFFSKTRLCLNKKGFSIIELLFSLVLLTIILSGLVPLLAKAIHSNKASKNKLYAYQAANAETENIRNTNFSDIASHTFAIPSIAGSQGNVTVSGFIDGAPQTGIVEATVTVTWQFKNKLETVEVKTYIAEKGIN